MCGVWTICRRWCLRIFVCTGVTGLVSSAHPCEFRAMYCVLPRFTSKSSLADVVSHYCVVVCRWHEEVVFELKQECCS